MADTDLDTLPIRRRVIDHALHQKGAHYLEGAAGNAPDQGGGAYYRPHGAIMHDNVVVPPSNRPHHSGQAESVLWAAWYRGRQEKICAGRCDQPDVSLLRVGDPSNPSHMGNPAAYRWARPRRILGARSEPIYGECCRQRLHFDCIGFINWCLGIIRPVHYDLAVLRTFPIVNPDNPSNFHLVNDPSTEIWTADILFIGHQHIAFAVDASRVVHAKGEQWGVVEGPLQRTDWTSRLRLPRAFWLQRHGI